MRVSLPVLDESILDRVGVATPCEADWNAMRGDDRVRHCRACRQNVYNLSAMTRGEALALIRTREGRVCVRLYRRTDGTLVTQDCWERLRAARRRGFGAFMAALILIGLSQMALKVAGVFAIANWWESRYGAHTRLMGEIEAVPPPVAGPAVPEAPTLPMMGAMAPYRQPTPEPQPRPEARPQRPARPVEPKHVKMGKMVHRPSGDPLSDPLSDPIMGDLDF